MNFEELRNKVYKSFRHLIIPAMGMFLFWNVCYIAKNFSDFTDVEYIYNFFINKLLTLLFASGDSVLVGKMEVEGIGIPWFLFVLFISRTIFDYLQLKVSKKWLIILCMLLSIIGVIIGRYQWLPFSFDIAIAILPILYVGNCLKNYNFHEKIQKKTLFGWFLVWGITLFLTFFISKNYMELAYRRYSLYPLCFITAVAGILAISEVSVILTAKVKYLLKPFCVLGRYSMYMLGVHYMDLIWRFIWYIEGEEYLSTILRVISDIIVFGILYYVFILKCNIIKNKESS